MSVQTNIRLRRLLLILMPPLLVLLFLLIAQEQMQQTAYSQGLASAQSVMSSASQAPGEEDVYPAELAADPPTGQTARLYGDDELPWNLSQ